MLVMSSMVLLIVMVIAFAIAIEEKFELLGPGFRMRDYQQVLKVKCAFACASECSLSPDCKGFNFNNASHQCDLIATKSKFYGSQAIIRDDTNWHLFERGSCGLGEKHGPHCQYFLLLSSVHTWQATRAFCVDMGVDLAVVADSSEMDALNVGLEIAYPFRPASAWIGASSPDGVTMKWVDGSSLTFTYFAATPGELGAMSCLLARKVSAGIWRWNYYDCSDYRAFVCERRNA